MPTRKAEAEWQGNLAEGSGRLKLASGAFDGPYSFKSRFEEGQSATNPEELIGAAHAGCFTMALTAQLSRAENHANAHPYRSTSETGKGRRRVFHHIDRVGDRGRHSWHGRRDISKICAGRQTELSCVEGAGRNEHSPDRKTTLANTATFRKTVRLLQRCARHS